MESNGFAGFVKLPRKQLDSLLTQPPTVLKVWTALLALAKFKEEKSDCGRRSAKAITVRVASLVTSYGQLVHYTHLSIKQVRNAIRRLEELELASVQRHPTHSLIRLLGDTNGSFVPLSRRHLQDTEGGIWRSPLHVWTVWIAFLAKAKFQEETSPIERKLKIAMPVGSLINPVAELVHYCHLPVTLVDDAIKEIKGLGLVTYSDETHWSVMYITALGHYLGHDIGHETGHNGGQASKELISKNTNSNTSPQYAVRQDTDTIGELVKIGYSLEAARQIASTNSAETVRQQIAWLPSRNPTQNRLGMLRSPIRENWPPPSEPGQLMTKETLAELSKGW